MIYYFKYEFSFDGLRYQTTYPPVRDSYARLRITQARLITHQDREDIFGAHGHGYDRIFVSINSMQPINIRRSVLTRNLSLEADLIYPTGSLSNAAGELEQLTDSSPSNVALAETRKRNETSSYLSPYTNLLVDGRRSSMGSCNSVSKTKQFPPNLLVIVQSLPGKYLFFLAIVIVHVFSYFSFIKF